jgi:membrane protein DedA with SNARE-associated domain/rhodanese-related sulfurtransferase
MTIALAFLLKYGYYILFAWVLLEQIGIPVPSVPLILTAGTLTATHRMNSAMVMFAIVLACLVSDSVWYMLGNRYGNSMVRLLCRISMEPATCVQKTKNSFTHRGPVTLLWAKFVPGLSAVAAPIAGQSGVSYPRFIAYDMAGSIIWAGTFLLAGRFFGDVIKRNADALRWLGHFAGGLVLLLVVAFFVYRVWKQNRFLKMVSRARVSPADLKQMMDDGLAPFIVDLRHPLDYLPDPRVVPTAIRMGPDDVASRVDELPRDRDIILYCTCPSDASSANTALKLRKLGIDRVRPLAGGFEAWRDLQYPLVEYVDFRPSPSGLSLPVIAH